jgi:3-deoxy-D-manno-octulosonic acid kinase
MSADQFRELVFTGGAMRFDPDRIARPGPFLFDPAAPQLQAMPVHVGGRQAAWYVVGDFGSGVLRHYRRGGLMARLSLDRYIWAGARRTRSFAEFELLDFMSRRGLAVPKPLAAIYWRHAASYRAAILVERIPNVQALARALTEPHHRAVAGAIFAMHNAGVWHADLNAYNILLDERNQVWLIDFDRGRRRAATTRLRNANLLRLRRSLIKVAGRAGLDYWNEMNHAYQDLLRDKSDR